MGNEAEEIAAPALPRDQLPDLSKALTKAAPQVQRQVFEAFDLQIAYDKAAHRVEISATVSEAARMPSKRESPPSGGLCDGHRRHGGAGFEPATFGL